ncbi:MgtC/SapB family protein [Lichenibacterium minor]|uniref:Protein MgtC n=1 Tax=Lichenibacterium minor TaxID=2316528 RepID=A0A4V1RUJ3_9HYPH|nr:MgtC/SapB family protein [Lichenibacterium minor]RYC31354.1 MgtC/SapB family protein [Lichenibacterium minor]
MTINPSLPDLLLRPLLALAAAALIGRERGANGHAAGLRTTMLVALAASLATALSGVLLSTHGKVAGDFSTMDVMRLPLGILTGVGFLGAGAILKRGKLVQGLTTAATLWAVTVIGIVFGAGEYALGLAATALCFGSLYGLKFVEARLTQHHDGTLTVVTAGRDLPAGWADVLGGTRCTALLLRQGFDADTARLTSAYKLGWEGPAQAEPPTGLLRGVTALDGVVSADVQVEEASS